MNIQRYDCLGAMIENEYGPYVYWAHAMKAVDDVQAQLDQANGHLHAVLEHIAPAMALYEKGMPEHPVIASIREHLKS